MVITSTHKEVSQDSMIIRELSSLYSKTTGLTCLGGDSPPAAKVLRSILLPDAEEGSDITSNILESILKI